jgi:hypothetical protein
MWLCRIPVVEEEVGTPILILSTRRCGSALLMEMIHSQPKVDYVAKPFNLWKPHTYKRQVPCGENSKIYTTPTDREIEKIKKFFDNVSVGNIRFKSQYNIFDEDYSFRVDRFVVKTTNMKQIVDKVIEEKS